MKSMEYSPNIINVHRNFNLNNNKNIKEIKRKIN